MIQFGEKHVTFIFTRYHTHDNFGGVGHEQFVNLGTTNDTYFRRPVFTHGVDEKFNTVDICAWGGICFPYTDSYITYHHIIITARQYLRGNESRVTRPMTTGLPIV